MLLEVIESGARYVSDRVELYDNGSEYKRSFWMDIRSIGHVEDVCGIQLTLLIFCASCRSSNSSFQVVGLKL